MTKVLIINTGGTFNKVYHPIHGKLHVEETGDAIKDITSKWLCNFDLINIIGKDSLEITSHDRLELLAMIYRSKATHIIVIHGTDTMDITASCLEDAEFGKCIILTGAMVPYSIDPVEATANFCAAYGYINGINKEGIYISMNGVLDTYDKVKKDRVKGKFTLS